MFGIVGSQNEIKCIFSVVGVITNFQCSKLVIDNLDCLTLVIKTLPNDACIGCVVNKLETCIVFCQVKLF